MSERNITGDTMNTVEINASLKACTGAPATIQPGCVVAMAESLKAIIDTWDGPLYRHEMHPNIQKARAALAMYNGGE